MTFRNNIISAANSLWGNDPETENKIKIVEKVFDTAWNMKPKTMLN